MDKEAMKKKIRQGAFTENNGRVLRAINLLRHKYERLRDVQYALDDIENDRFLDSINFLSEAEYIKLRKIGSKESAAIEDVDDYALLEAKLTEKGIRLLGGKIVDDMVKA